MLGGRQIAERVCDGAEVVRYLVVTARLARDRGLEIDPRLAKPGHPVEDAAEIFERVGMLGRKAEGLARAGQRRRMLATGGEQGGDAEPGPGAGPADAQPGFVVGERPVEIAGNVAAISRRECGAQVEFPLSIKCDQGCEQGDQGAIDEYATA